MASVECIQSVMGSDGTEFGSMDFTCDIDSIQFKDVTFSYSTETMFQSIAMESSIQIKFQWFFNSLILYRPPLKKI